MSVILVVDSSMNDLMTFERLLAEKCQCQACLASDAWQALAHLHSNGASIDAIICGDIGAAEHYRPVIQYVYKNLWPQTGERGSPALIVANGDTQIIRQPSGLFPKKGLLEHLEKTRPGDITVVEEILYNNGKTPPQEQGRESSPKGFLTRLQRSMTCAM